MTDEYISDDGPGSDLFDPYETGWWKSVSNDIRETEETPMSFQTIIIAGHLGRDPEMTLHPCLGGCDQINLAANRSSDGCFPLTEKGGLYSGSIPHPCKRTLLRLELV